MKILYLTPGIDADGAAAQLATLARGLAQQGHEVRFRTLGPVATLPGGLDGVDAAALGWERTLDPRPLFQLRRLVREFRPDVIHACRPASLRAVALAAGRPPCRLVVSHPFPLRSRGEGRPGLLLRWSARMADAVVADSSAEASRCVRAGVSISRVCVIPHGVTAAAVPPAQDLPGDPSSRRLLCVGRLEEHKGFRDAVWALDVLRYLDRGLRLVVAGEGPERRRLARFAARIRTDENTDLLGRREDVPALIAAADVVWVPRLADGGVRVALEAMAAGRPVVGSRLPALMEVIRDGESGLLVPPGDRIELARATLRLLENDGLRAAMGAAGLRQAQTHFNSERSVAAAGRLYEQLAA